MATVFDDDMELNIHVSANSTLLPILKISCHVHSSSSKKKRRKQLLKCLIRPRKKPPTGTQREAADGKERLPLRLTFSISDISLLLSVSR